MAGELLTDDDIFGADGSAPARAVVPELLSDDDVFGSALPAPDRSVLSNEAPADPLAVPRDASGQPIQPLEWTDYVLDPIKRVGRNVDDFLADRIKTVAPEPEPEPGAPELPIPARETFQQNLKASQPPPPPPRLGGLETAGAINDQIWDAVLYHLPSALAGAVQGGELAPEGSVTRSLIERSRARTDQQQRLAGKGPTAIPGVGREDIAQLGPSAAFSAVGMAGGLGAGLPAAALSAPMLGPAAPVAGFAAGGAASGVLAYRMATNQFVHDLHDAVNEDRKSRGEKPIAEAEFNAKMGELAPLIQEYGLWEAIPEAASNILGFAILKAPVKIGVGKLFGEGVLGRTIKKGAALYGEELTTETITQHGQHNAEAAAKTGLGLTPEAERSWRSPLDIATSLEEVAPVTVLQTTLMAGGFKAAAQFKRLKPGQQDAVLRVPPKPGEGLRQWAERALKEAEDGDAAATPASATTETADLPEGAVSADTLYPGPAEQPEPEAPAPLPPHATLTRAVAGAAAPEDAGAPVPSDLPEAIAAQPQGQPAPTPPSDMSPGLQPDGELPPAAPPPGRDASRRDDLQALLDDPRSADEIRAERANAEIIAKAAEDFARFGVATKNIQDRIEAIRQNLGNDQAGVYEKEYDRLIAEAVEARRTAPGSRAAPVQVQSPADLDAVADQVNPDPTPDQRKAENYKMIHGTLGPGLDFSIETAKGGTRTAADGSWSVPNFPAHYGRFKGTEGADGDHVDFFYDGPKPFIIDQLDAQTGKFDEHKIVFANDQAHARAIYNAAFSDGKANQRLGEITPVSVDQLRSWLKSGNTKKPFAWTPPKDMTPKPSRARGPLSVIEFIAQNGGISPKDPLIADVRSILGTPNRFIPGFGMLIRPTGRGLDAHREALVEAGYLRDPGNDTGGLARTTAADVLELMDSNARGGKVHSEQDRQEVAERADADLVKAAQSAIKELREAVKAEGLIASEKQIEDAARSAAISSKAPIDELVDILERDAVAQIEQAAQAVEDEESSDEVDQPAARAVGEASTSTRQQSSHQGTEAGEPAPRSGNPDQPERIRGEAEDVPETPGAGQPADEGRAGDGDQSGGRAIAEGTGTGRDAQAAGDGPVTVRTETPPPGTPIPKAPNYDQGPHYAAGRKAREAGEPRKLPSYFKNSVGKNPRDWLRGWDAGTVPVVLADNVSANTPQKSEPSADVDLKSNKPDETTEAPETGPSDSAETSNGVTPAIRLARSLLADLKTGAPITSKMLQQTAARVYGGTLAEGKFDRRDMADALELAVNLHVKETRHLRVDSPNPQHAIKMLSDVLDTLPTQRVRSEEQVSFQQFSTPPNYAAAAVYVANLTNGDVMLEPSAGTGSLVAAASRPGVKIIANELSERRAGLLRELLGKDGQVFTENAEQLNNILPDDVKPSVVVMNPPFAQTAGRMGDRKVPMVAANHVEQGLLRLEPGGRLVAIVNGGLTMGAPTYRAWWKKIGEKYAVRANISVDGQVFEKYGTTFGTRLLVIDKVAPTGEPPILSEAQTVEDLMRILEPIRDGRPIIERGGAALAAGSRRQGRSDASPSAPQSGDVGAGERGGGRLAAAGDAGAPPASGKPVRVETGQRDGVAAVEPERPGQERAGDQSPVRTDDGDQPAPRGGTRAERDLGEAGGRQPGAATSGERVELENAAPASQASTSAEISESLYEGYKPQRVRVKGAKPHPGPLVQSAAMASVEPPAPSYRPALPSNVIERGLLSNAQLEAVIYAGQAHEKMLPAKEGEPEARRGYFIGDGTGVGKGREVAGILLDNWMQGRTKGVWVSEKRTLLQDARRDWSGLGQNANVIFDIGKVKSGEKVDVERGIGFITYDTLKGGMSDQAAIARGAFVRKQKVSVNGQAGTVVRVIPKGKDKPADVVVSLANDTQVTVPANEVTTQETANVKSRVDQIVEWFGPGFDGVIAFDEAHNMGNAMSVKGGRGIKEAALKALAGVDLQRRLPNARVVYVSATGATEVYNLAYAERLGLWGRGTPFASRDKFVSEIEKGGVAAMELVARDMKSLGLYTARNLSYDGVEYERVEHKLTPNQRETYDTLAEAWQGVLNNINAALEVTDAKADGRAKGAAYSAFWGAHQRFFNQIVTSMQMPSVIKAVEKDLAAGHQVVFQLTNTNEASQERAAAKAQTAEEIEDLDITPRDQIIQLVEKSFPTQQYEEYVDDDGKKRARPVVDSQDRPVQNKEAVAMREALIDRLASVRVPQGPLDLLLDHFGTDVIAEVTGRGRRFVIKEDPKTGEKRRMEESRPGSANIAETDAFQAGKKKGLIFSEAGGTGRSYHADNAAPSKGARRVHYLLQGGWRADKAVQGFGRTHRTNQASAPIFRLVTTDLQGQKRFISSIARRLAQLGALTKGQRQAGDQGVFSARDNLESTEASEALKQFFTDLVRDRVDGVTVDGFEEQTGLKLRNRDNEGRVMGALQETPPITQFLNRLLSLKIDMQNAVFEAFAERLDAVIEARAAAGLLDVGLETVRADKIEKVSDRSVHKVEGTDAETKHVKFKVSNRFKAKDFDDVSNNRSNKIAGHAKSPQGKVYILLEAPSVTDAASGRIVDQYRLVGPVSESRLIPRENIDRQDRGESSGQFKSKWERIKEPQARRLWKAETEAAPEFISRDLNLITGAILPIWDRIGGTTRVVRLRTDDGEQFLGRVVPNSQIAPTLQRLGAGGEEAKVDADALYDRLMANGRAKLANGWTLKRSLVAGEQRIELIGPESFSEGQEAKGDGVFTERIDYQTRYFVPASPEEGKKVLAALTKYRPVAELSERGGGETALKQDIDRVDRIEWEVLESDGDGEWIFIRAESGGDLVFAKSIRRGGLVRWAGRDAAVEIKTAIARGETHGTANTSAEHQKPEGVADSENEDGTLAAGEDSDPSALASQIDQRQSFPPPFHVVRPSDETKRLSSVSKDLAAASPGRYRMMPSVQLTDRMFQFILYERETPIGAVRLSQSGNSLLLHMIDVRNPATGERIANTYSDRFGIPPDALAQQFKAYFPGISTIAIAPDASPRLVQLHAALKPMVSKGAERAVQLALDELLAPAATTRRVALERLLTTQVRLITGANVRVQFDPGERLAKRADQPSRGYPTKTNIKGPRGMYFPGSRLIELALGNPDVGSTAFHEAWHDVELHLLRRNELALLIRETDRLRSILTSHFGVPRALAEKFAGYEVRAYAFQAWANHRAGSGPPIHTGIARIFARIARLLRQVANALRGQGFISAETFFERAFAGEFAGRPDLGVSDAKIDALAQASDPKSEPGADGKPQLIIPGAERVSDKELAERRAREAKRSRKPQQGTDGLPLFNDESKQGALFQSIDPTGAAAFKRWFGDSKVVDGSGKPLVVYHGTSAPIEIFDPAKRGTATGAPSAEVGFFFTNRHKSSRYYAEAATRQRALRSYERAHVERMAKLYDDLASFNEGDAARAYSEQAQAYRDKLGENVTPTVLSVYLSLQKPLVHDFKGKVYRDESYRALIDRARAEGHDGVILKNTYDAGEYSKFDAIMKGRFRPETIYVAFEPTQIKSAIGNSGAFDPNNPSALKSLLDPITPDSTATERQQAMQGFIARGQPIDRAIRLPFEIFGGTTPDGQWKPGQKVHALATRIITGAKFSPEGRFAFLNPVLETARSGLIDRYNLKDLPGYVDRERARALDERAVMLHGAEVLKSLKDHSVGPAEAKVLQAILNGEDVDDDAMKALAEPIRAAIDQLGQEAVALGLVSPESFERNRATYLHRVYKKYEADQNGLTRMVNSIMGSKRKKIIGNQFKGRGIFEEIPLARLMKDIRAFHEGARGKPQNGDKFVVLDEMPTQGALELTGEAAAAERPLRRVYLPADRPIPDRYAGFRNNGTFEVRGFKDGKVVIWRDYTKPERVKMGEILDARYTIAKTFMQMAHDLSVGRFYHDIALNEDWASTTQPEGRVMDAAEWQAGLHAYKARTVDWVRVPTTVIADTGGKKRYAALAGMYVREEIWRDLHELDVMTRPNAAASFWRALLSQWKLNKTARSPTVHMNNVMSNFILMDLMDVRMQDLITGVKSYANGDAHYREAFENGAFGADLISQEIRDEVLKPILDELERSNTFQQGGRLGALGQVTKFTDILWSGLKRADKFMRDAYRVEDEVFRMAAYIRRRELGDDAKQAAQAAREQFIDYDIRAPWVRAARNTMLPFISYTYRAAPLVAKAVATRPWKIAKYFALAYGLNALAYAMSGGDEDRERRSLPEREQGRTWIGVPRMMRMPIPGLMKDSYGNPIFLDINRWIPAGDVFDTQGDLPAWLNLGGPLMLGAELFLNRQAFTGREIFNTKTDDLWDRTAKRADHLYKSWVPSAAYVPGSWYWEKVSNAIRGATDRQGRPYSVPLALSSSVGIKLKPQDVEDGFALKGMEFDRIERELETEGRRLASQRARNMLSEAEFNRAMNAILTKQQRLAEKARETFK